MTIIMFIASSRSFWIHADSSVQYSFSSVPHRFPDDWEPLTSPSLAAPSVGSASLVLISVHLTSSSSSSRRSFRSQSGGSDASMALNAVSCNHDFAFPSSLIVLRIELESRFTLDSAHVLISFGMLYR